MSSREIILGRIREALRIPAERHDGGGATSGWAAPVPESIEGLIELFDANARSLKAEFHVCANAAEAAGIVRGFGWKKMARHAGELTDAVAGKLGLPEMRTDAGYAVEDLESCDGGLTECEALVAATGSVLVSARTCGGRALSVLPPHHVALARRSQITGNLSGALQRMREKHHDDWPSLLSFITGPSRTGDIERILVLGAHGPKRLTILLLP